jgi:Flp pilus assembly pilin Flp
MLNLIQYAAVSLQMRALSIAEQVRESEKGQTFVEYALVIGGVSIALLAAFAGLSGALTGVVTKIKTALGVT